MFEHILKGLSDIAVLCTSKLSLDDTLVVALILINNLERGPILETANYIHLDHEMVILFFITAFFAIEMKAIAFPLSLIYITYRLLKAV